MSEEIPDLMTVEVAYALPQRQVIISLKVKAGTTALEAIEHSGLLLEYPELSLKNGKIGVFGKLISFDTVLHPLDRVEIYRPLLVDPKQARRLRATTKKDKAAKSGQQKRQKA